MGQKVNPIGFRILNNFAGLKGAKGLGRSSTQN